MHKPIKQPALLQLRIYVTGFVTLSIWTLLLWTHFHGGVPSHQFLQRADWPAISNWWGGLLLPVLIWILVYRIQARIIKTNSHGADLKIQLLKTAINLILSLALGILLAVSFNLGYTLILDNILYVLLFLGFIVPIFHAEYILGFVLGMTITFGGILPSIFALTLALIGFLLYRFVRQAFIYLLKLIGGKMRG